MRPIVYDDVGRSDIVAPFLAALGLDLDKARLAPVGRENASMHRRKVLFLGGFPKPAAAVRRGAARFPAGFVARVLAASDAVADDGGRFLLSPAERHALVAAHIEGNRALVARHGIADPGGFVELPDPAAPWTPPAPITRREVAAVWREMLAAAGAGRDPLRAAWLAARLSRPFAAMAVRAAARRAGGLMRRLYLHVGLHKTGTSFLQRLLLENRELFAAAGLGLGPFQDPSGSHHPIVEAIEAEGPEAIFARVAEAQGRGC